MARSQEDAHRVNVSIDRDTQLGDEWEQWKANYSSDAAAARQAIRQELLRDGETTQEASLSLAQTGAAALSAGALGIMVGQAALVFDAVVAGGLAAVALLTVAAVLLYPNGE